MFIVYSSSMCGETAGVSMTQCRLWGVDVTCSRGWKQSSDLEFHFGQVGMTQTEAGNHCTNVCWLVPVVPTAFRNGWTYVWLAVMLPNISAASTFSLLHWNTVNADWPLSQDTGEKKSYIWRLWRQSVCKEGASTPPKTSYFKHKQKCTQLCHTDCTNQYLSSLHWA